MGNIETFTLALLLLLGHGIEGQLFAVTNPTAFLVGQNINLTFSSKTMNTTDTTNTVINWIKDTTPILSFTNGQMLSGGYKLRVNESTPTSLLLINATKNDTGLYSVTWIYYGSESVSHSLQFNVTIYDRVQNVTVEISPSIVSEITPVVNLTCNATAGAETFTWRKDGMSLPTSNLSHSFLDGNKILQLKNLNLSYNGRYTCNVSNPVDSVDRTEELNVFLLVKGVTVASFPERVSEGAPVVNLSCAASVGGERFTWQKDGKPFLVNDNPSFLNENRTLQINSPNNTHNGVYTCIVSNPVSWNNSSFTLVIHSTLSTGAIVGIVIGSVCGACLLIALIVLIVYFVRKGKGKKEKNPAGPQHNDVLRTVSGNTLSPDDPAYFTINNIMYRNSSISMGSCKLYSNTQAKTDPACVWDVSESNRGSTPTSQAPSHFYKKPKHATQV